MNAKSIIDLCDEPIPFTLTRRLDLRPKPRRLIRDAWRRLLQLKLAHFMPIAYAHHKRLGFGYVLLPQLPIMIGLFVRHRASTGLHVALTDVKRKDFHNCTWSGTY